MRGESRRFASEGVESQTDDLDFGAMGRALSRRKSWILGATLVALVASLVFVFGVRPRYTGDSQVLIENQENFFTRPDAAVVNPEQPPDDAAVTSQIQLITSRDLARQAIASLKLTKNPEFNPHADPGLISRVMVIIGLSRAPSSLSEEDQILQNYYSRLTVFQVAKSRVLEIDFTSQNPDLAARAANVIADLYIGVQISAKRQEARDAAASLSSQVADLQKRMADAEDRAESFRASSGLVLGPNNTTLSSQQLADLNSELATARAASNDATAKAKLIRGALAAGRLDEISDIANNELVRQISIQRVTLRSQLALLSRTLLPQHPQIKELRAQIDDIDVQLRNAAITVARGLENDARLGEARLESIQKTLDQQKKEVGDSGADEVRMRALDRDSKLIGDQLDATTAKYQEAVARETATSTPGDARVISRAIAPQLPSFPKKVPTIVFVTLAGFVLSVAAALAAELLSTGERIGSVHETDPDLPMPRIVAEPVLRPRRPDLAWDARSEPPISFADSAQSRSQADAADNLDSLVGRAVAVRSASRKAACVLATGVSVRMAAGAWAVEIGRRLSTEGRTILIELRDGLLTGSGLEPARHWNSGLGDLVAGERSFAEIIDRDDVSRLHFILAGKTAIPSGEGLDMALEALGETYDYIVMLASAPGADPLTFDLAGAADIAVIIDGAEGSSSEAAELRLDLIRAGVGDVMTISTEDVQERVDAA